MRAPCARSSVFERLAVNVPPSPSDSVEYGDRGRMEGCKCAGALGGSSSYGVHVARLAGLPPQVTDRTNEILGRLESEGVKDFAG